MISKRYLEIESLLFGKVDLKPSDLTPIENTTLTELMKQIEEANDSSLGKGNSSIAGSSISGDVTSLEDDSSLSRGDASSVGDIASLREDSSVEKGDAISVVDITSPQEEVEVRFIANP